MKTYQLAVVALAASTLCSASLAQANCKRPSPPTPVISKVTAAPFQLVQVATKKLSDTMSTSLYKADAVLTITGTDPAVAPVQVPVKVELRTQTMLNTSGDGLTDGLVSIYAPATKQLICGSLVAVNENFGELTGTIEGAIMARGAAPIRLRVAFHGVFAQDTAGAYTLVNVDAHGVQIVTPAPDRKR